MTTTMKGHTLDLWAGDHDLHGVLVDQVHEPKLRATIRRNSYDHQSVQKVEAWTTANGWETIRSLPIKFSRVADHSYTSREGTWEVDMAADLTDLMTWAHNFFEGMP